MRTRLTAAIALSLAMSMSYSYSAGAHFKLVEPASWIVENERGDPQKLAPCGGAAPQAPAGAPQAAGTAAPSPRVAAPAPAAAAAIVQLTNAVTKVVGGSKLHLKLQETIYHPGHYRVALAVNSRTELPPDPMTFERTTDRGPFSVWAVIQSPPQIPVIADGLFQHYTRPARPAGATPESPIFESDIQLPNISCPKCTLQILQFMAEHGYNQPGGYSYHHCADLQITADPAKPIDRGWPTATS